jgi:glutathione reductase (NADPH)
MYDLIVIGGGSGGVAAAKKAAIFGKKVLLCEADKMGGTCVSYGCVPKKLLHQIAHFDHSVKLAKAQGWSIEKLSFSWLDARKKFQDYVSYLNQRYLSTCVDLGITVINGFAKLVDSTTIELENKRYSAKKILIAVGSKAEKLDIAGTQLCDTSYEFFSWSSLPKSVVVVGGGYIAVEIASILNALGVKTDVVIRKDLILTGFDHELQTHLQSLLIKRGINFHTGVNIKSFEKNSSLIKITLSSGKILESEKVLQAVGRRPNTANLGCVDVGVECSENGAINVNSEYQTTVDSIYALGDCVDQVQLTPVAIAQARKWAHKHFSQTKFNAFFDYIPTAVFSLPEAAVIGLSQTQAEEKYDNVSMSLLKFNPLLSALSIDHKEQVFIKVVYQGVNQHVVGIHIVCEGASEIIQGLAVAVQKGITKTDLDNTMALHPSISEELVTIY